MSERVAVEYALRLVRATGWDIGDVLPAMLREGESGERGKARDLRLLCLLGFLPEANGDCEFCEAILAADDSSEGDPALSIRESETLLIHGGCGAGHCGHDPMECNDAFLATCKKVYAFPVSIAPQLTLAQRIHLAAAKRFGGADIPEVSIVWQWRAALQLAALCQDEQHSGYCHHHHCSHGSLVSVLRDIIDDIDGLSGSQDLRDARRLVVSVLCSLDSSVGGFYLTEGDVIDGLGLDRCKVEDVVKGDVFAADMSRAGTH